MSPNHDWYLLLMSDRFWWLVIFEIVLQIYLNAVWMLRRLPIATWYFLVSFFASKTMKQPSSVCNGWQTETETTRPEQCDSLTSWGRDEMDAI